MMGAETHRVIAKNAAKYCEYYCNAICCNIIIIIICTDCSRIQPAYSIGEKFCSKLLMLQYIYI